MNATATLTAPVKVPDLTVTEAARSISQQLGRPFSVSTVWGWVTTGKLRGRRIGRKWYIDAAALAQFLGDTNPAA